MRNLILKHGCRLLFILIPFGVFAQWESGHSTVVLSIPEVALIDIEFATGSQVQFTLLPSAEAGNASEIKETSQANLWINYSSALRAGQDSRSITAEVSQGQIPAGIKLYLEALKISGGNGQRGAPTGKVELSNQPRPIISGIGNCFTGDGINNGHQLSFSIEIANYPEFKSSGETNFLVLYTLTDN
jgi:hypothetical protein